jgi:hypothetical protein
MRSLLVVWLAGVLALLLQHLLSRSLVLRRRLWPLLPKPRAMLLPPGLAARMSRWLVLLRQPLRPLLLLLLPPVLAERRPRELLLLPVPAGLTERDSCLRARS